MSQIFRIVTGGLSGLANHLTDNTGKVTPEVAQQFGVEPDTQAIHHFNCAYKNKILLQGKLYIYTDRACFFSNFNNRNIVGDQKTIIVMKFLDLQEISKYRFIIHDSIQFTKQNQEQFIFTSFLKRNTAYNLINSIFQIKKEELLDEELFKMQLKEIQRQQQASEQFRDQMEEEVGSNVPYQNQQQQQSQVSDLGSIYGNQNNNDSGKKDSKFIKKMSEIQQEESKDQNQQYQSEFSFGGQKNDLVKSILQLKKECEDNEQQNDIEIENAQNQLQNLDKQNNLEAVQEIQNPLEVQKNNEKNWQEFRAQLKEIFAPREISAQEVLAYHNRSENQVKWGQEAFFDDLNVQEFYLLFFSNQEFIDPKEKKKYNNFFEYYMMQIHKEYNIKISEILPEPPLVYQSIYCDDKLEIAEHDLTSTRTFRYIHPLEKSFFMPDKLQGLIKDKFYWVSDEHFILERSLSYEGAKIVDSFEVRVLMQLKQKGTGVQLSSGYYIHFTKNTWFKSKVKSEAQKQYEAAEKDLEQMFTETLKVYKEERQKNKMMLSQQNKNSFIKPSREEVEEEKQNSIKEQEAIQEERLIQSQLKSQIYQSLAKSKESQQNQVQKQTPYESNVKDGMQQLKYVPQKQNQDNQQENKNEYNSLTKSLLQINQQLSQVGDQNSLQYSQNSQNSGNYPINENYYLNSSINNQQNQQQQQQQQDEQVQKQQFDEAQNVEKSQEIQNLISSQLQQQEKEKEEKEKEEEKLSQSQLLELQKQNPEQYQQELQRLGQQLQANKSACSIF